MNLPAKLNLDTRKALMFALVAERLSAYYEHNAWITEAQGATLAAQWLSRSKLRLELAERRALSGLSDDMAREMAAALSREAGLYTVHEMMEALDPNYQSGLAMDLLDDCERRLREQGLADL